MALPRDDRHRWLLGLLGIFLLSVAVLGPALGGGTLWGDDRDIMSGKAIGGGKSFLACFTKPFLGLYYRPLTSASFFIDTHSILRSPALCHVVNATYHGLTAVLVALVVLAAFRSRRLALLSGIFFAVQPAQILAAGWIGGRTDDLSTLLATAFVLCLVKWRLSQSRFWSWIAVIAYFAALMAKEQAIALLPLAPLACFVWPETSKPWRSGILATLPFLAATLVFGMLWSRFHVPPPMFGREGFREIVGDTGRSAVFYAALFLIPNPVQVFSFTLLNYPSVLWPIAGFLLLGLLLLSLFLLLRSSREPLHSVGGNRALVAFFLVWALLAYLPVSNLIPIPSFVVGSYRAALCGPAIAALLALAVLSLWLKRRVLAYLPLAAGLCGIVLTPWAASKLIDEPVFFAYALSVDPLGHTSGLNSAGTNLKRSPSLAQAQSEQVLNYLFDGPSWRGMKKPADVAKHDPRVARRLHFRQENNASASEVVARALDLRTKALRAEKESAVARAGSRRRLANGRPPQN